MYLPPIPAGLNPLPGGLIADKKRYEYKTGARAPPFPGSPPITSTGAGRF